MKQGSASLLVVQRGKFIPFGNITGGISSCVCFKCFLFPLLLQSQGGPVWIRWMETGMHEQESSQSPTVSGFSEVLHDTSLESCEANGKFPPSRQWLLRAHNSTERAARQARHGWRQSTGFSPLKQSPVFYHDKLQLQILAAMAHSIVTKVLTVSVEVA